MAAMIILDLIIRMTEMQAAIGRQQLKSLDKQIKKEI